MFSAKEHTTRNGEIIKTRNFTKTSFVVNALIIAAVISGYVDQNDWVFGIALFFAVIPFNYEVTVREQFYLSL